MIRVGSSWHRRELRDSRRSATGEAQLHEEGEQAVEQPRTIDEQVRDDRERDATDDVDDVVVAGVQDREPDRQPVERDEPRGARVASPHEEEGERRERGVE
jgi:hypothetical protein